MDPAFDNLPIIPHENVADVDCCGCLMVCPRGDQADIVCNECGGVIQTVPISDVEAAMLELAQTDTACGVHCTHCRALNIFPGMSAIMAFICRECGEDVDVARSVQ
jgi:hypothetical protein